MTVPKQDSPETFTDVINRIQSDLTLSPTNRRDCVSDLKSLARMLDLDPSQIPANTDWLRQRLKLFHPKKARISSKRYANIKSSVTFALRHTGAGTKRAGWLPPMSSEWGQLYERAGDDVSRYKLSRLFRWCSSEHIAPKDLSDKHIDAFEAMLVGETLTKDPHKSVRNAVNQWNRYGRELEGWPSTKLSPMNKRERWTFPLENFPDSFRVDVEAWFTRSTIDDIFDEDAPIRPMRPATVKHRRTQIRCAASALVRSGMPINTVTSLAVLVEVSNFKKLLQYMIDRAGGAPTEAIFGLASGLKAIGLYHVKVPPEQADAIKQICSKLNRVADRTRATKKTRLEQFDDIRALQTLLALPKHLAEQPPGPEAKPQTAPLMLQVACCLEILFLTAMRINNLANLDLERHLRWAGSGRRLKLYISIPGHEVKNGKPLSFELTGSSAELVQRYINGARKKLTRDPSSTALFPKRDGTPKNPADLSNQIKRSVFKHTGLDVTPHLIRSLVARIHNQFAAGDYGTVAHVLGDRIGTVMKSYANFEQQTALRSYQTSVLELRDQEGTRHEH